MDIPLTSIFGCARMIIFQNDNPDYPVSISGSGFIVRYRSRLFVVTALHVTKGFEHHQVRVQYHPNMSTVIPLLRPYTIAGNDPDDTDQYDIIVLAVDEAKLDPALFGEYRPYDLLEMDALTIFNPTSSFASRGFPTCLRRLSYDERSVDFESLIVDAAYEGRAGPKETHLLRVHRADEIESFDGMSGAPVFQVRQDEEKYSHATFAGMLLRGGATSGIVRFLEHGKIISVLTKIVTGDVEPTEE